MTARCNVLFTCAGRRVELLNAFRDALDQLGLEGQLLASDATRACPAWQLADVGLTAPRVDDPGYLPWLVEAARRHEVGLLVPATDLDLLVLADNRDAFAKVGTTVHVGSPSAVRACRDKAETSRRVAAAGLAPVQTCSLEEFRDEPFWPCFVKPVSGSASRGAERIDTQADLDVHIQRFGERLIVQEVLEGAEMTIDVYRGRDGTVRCVVPRQRLAVRSGEVEKGVTVHDAELIDTTCRLSQQFDGLWGVYCCQCRRLPGLEPRFFEINPRFGGGAPLSIAAGANLPLYLLQETLGQEVTAEIGTFTDHLLMLRYDQAVYQKLDCLDDLPGLDGPSFR
jgi:carbamoyl-phosphate synthase large subunit